MSLLSKLFGKSEPPKAVTIAHEGYTITPQPIQEGGQFRLAALIEKDGKTHHLIRADTLASAEAATEAAIAKAKQVIDQQGDRIF
jgi:hypothetical protein